jgi:hypothetical protein
MKKGKERKEPVTRRIFLARALYGSAFWASAPCRQHLRTSNHDEKWDYEADVVVGMDMPARVRPSPRMMPERK